MLGGSGEFDVVEGAARLRVGGLGHAGECTTTSSVQATFWDERDHFATTVPIVVYLRKDEKPV